MLVFRDGRRAIAVRPLIAQLISHCHQGAPLPALLRAGELECLLTDAADPAHEPASTVTDHCAEALMGARFDPSAADRLAAIPAAEMCGTGSVPEGFAYYALHPRDYADAMAFVPPARSAMVVGIRTIGTTLSAVAQAGLVARGSRCERMTVRPTGHPWARETHFTENEKQRLRAAREAGAQFVIVDEGPGLSGSSFLSVAEALVALGIPPERLTLVGSHAVDAARLCARDAAARWECFRYFAVESANAFPGSAELSGGAWRRFILGAAHAWPGSWTQFERRKALSCDGRTLFKFEGLGHYGEGALARAEALAEEGFSPHVEAAGDGFAAYRFIRGTPLLAAQVDRDILQRIAEYCALRSERMRVPAAENAGLREMVEVNWREGFGTELAAPELPVVRPVIADGRMQAHEWRRAVDGALLKTDATSHGDDHFFPGPTDIAWDLAGAIVEWGLDGVASEFLLARYRRLTGDDAGARLSGFLLAYTLFRLGYSQMAADAMRGSEEEGRLRREERRYRALASGRAPARVAA